MGRSRGGLTTKIHAMVDANGMPIGLRLSEGQAYDGHSAHLMLDTLVPGSILLADRAYDADKLRAAIADKGRRQGGLRQHPAHAPACSPLSVQPIPLSLSQPGRTLLQQTQAFQGHRNPIRQT